MMVRGMPVLTVEQGELAGDAPSHQSPGCITLRVSGAIDDEFAAADYTE